MKHLTPKLILLAFSGLMMLASCEYEYTVVPAEPVDTTSATDTISFSQDIMPLFLNSCATSNCHAGKHEPDLRTGKAYASLTDGNFVIANNPDNSVIYQVSKPGGSMYYLTSTELKLLKRWISAGAKDN
jgi:hypothetical protein